jgi:hypothetical protein
MESRPLETDRGVGRTNTPIQFVPWGQYVGRKIYPIYIRVPSGRNRSCRNSGKITDATGHFIQRSRRRATDILSLF